MSPKPPPDWLGIAVWGIGGTVSACGVAWLCWQIYLGISDLWRMP